MTLSYDWSLAKRFWRYLKPQWPWLLVGSLAIPFSIASSMLTPWIITKLIDESIPQQDLDSLTTWVGALAGLVILGYLTDAVYTFSLQKAGQHAISEMRRQLFRHVLGLPRSFYDRTPMGVLLTRLTSDMEALGESLATGALSLITDILKTVGLLIILFTLSWQLTLVTLVLLPPLYVLSRWLRKRLRHYSNETRRLLAEATGFLQECLNGMKTVQLYSIETFVQKKFSGKNQEFYHAQTRSNFYDAALFSVIDGVTFVVMAIMLWFGARQILQEALTVGVLIAFIHALQRMFVPIREFTQQITIIQRAFSALENIDALFQQPSTPVVQSSTMNPSLEFQSLVFDQVSFRYSKDASLVLDQVSFELKPGQRLALVGATGSGKSTIVKLLTKSYEGYEGNIWLNGKELSEWSRLEACALMGMMSQDVVLFDESIAFNIGLARPGIERSDIQKASEYVYAHQFIESLPGSYDFQVLENGANLSTGQSQLIALARVMAGNPDVIILDEATSAVDSITENLIQKAIERVFSQKTVIAIAHRLSTIQHADQILVLSAGKIVEQGTHSELLTIDGGVYQQLSTSFT